MFKKLISLICVLAMLVLAASVTLVYAAEYVMEKPVDPSMWEEPHFDTDHAYSIAFVGDTQYITCGDSYLGTKKLKYQFKYIADTAKERKLEHVFVLGDITDLGYKNDGNLAGAYYSSPKVSEWLIAKEAILQLNGSGATYSLCRGNHDDYMIDYFFNVPEYTDQFKDIGGFYSDSDAKWTDIEGVTKSRESDNPEAYVYWDALTGKHHEESIVNSWMTKEICGTKYLFITVDFNPTENVLNWLNEILEKYPDHKAIVTMHAYLGSKGDLIQSEQGSTMYLFGNSGDEIWEKALKKHENVFMVVSGHIGVNDIVYSYQTGDHGNKVLQVLVDPQGYDAKEINKNGDIEHGTQDTGLVLYMNFSEDGKTITLDYYSTLLGKFLKVSRDAFYLEDHTHKWDEGYIVSLPTTKENGTKLYTCEICANTKEVTIERPGKTDARDLAEYGQQHHYLGDMISGAKPNSTDGTVSNNEYSYSFEYSPNSPQNVVTVSGGNGYTDTESVKTYMSYDERYFYVAVEVKDKVYCPDKDSIILNLAMIDGGSTVNAVSRIRYSFTGDASKKVLANSELPSTIGLFYKLDDGSWGDMEGVSMSSHIPERSLYWNSKTGTLTLEAKVDIQVLLDYWKNEKEIEDAELYFFTIVQMYGDKSAGAGDGATDQGMLWYYFNNGNSQALKSAFKKEYTETSYWINWFPHIVHFSHNWGEGVQVSESTHLEHGIASYECKDCDATKNEKFVKIPHVFNEDFKDYDDECHARLCSECGEYEKELHEYENGKCVVCGRIFVEKTEAVTTTVVSDVDTKPTTPGEIKGGCKSAVGFSAVVSLIGVCGVAYLARKRCED